MTYCGISTKYYRANMNILEETNIKYYYSLLSDKLDFNRSPRFRTQEIP